MKKEAYEVEYYEPKSVLAMQADRREEKHRRKQKKGIRAGRILLGVAILLFWEVSARLGWIDDYYWSSPSLIAQTAIVQWKEKNLAYDIYFTSMSTIGGFLAGTLGGAVLGLSFWWSKTFAKIFEPYLVMFNAIPKLALAPILIVLFGIGFSSKVMLAFLMTVISCALATVSGVENVDESMETLLYSLGAARWQVFGKVVVPAVLPWMLGSLRINISLALAGAIVGEFIASGHGLGRMVIYAGTILDTTLVWVGVIVLSLLEIYEKLARYCDEQISKAVLGQTLSSDSGGSYAQGKVHNEVRHDLTVGDAKALAVTVRRDIIRPLVEYNFGYDADVPFFTFDCQEAEDQKETVEIYKTLVCDMGLEIPKNHIYKKFNIPKPEDGEEVLNPRLVTETREPYLPEDEGDEKSLKEEIGQTEQEQIDLMAVEAQKQAENAFHEMLKPILNMLDKTDDLETLKEVLKDKNEIKKLYEQMDSPELEDILHQAIYLSELLGRSME